MNIPTLTDPAAFKRPQDRQEFFERIMRETPQARASFLRRPFFVRKSKEQRAQQQPR